MKAAGVVSTRRGTTRGLTKRTRSYQHQRLTILLSAWPHQGCRHDAGPELKSTAASLTPLVGHDGKACSWHNALPSSTEATHLCGRRPLRRQRDASAHQRGCAAWAGHLDSLGAAIVAGLDVELDLLALSKAAEAVGDDARLRRHPEGKQISLTRSAQTLCHLALSPSFRRQPQTPQAGPGCPKEAAMYMACTLLRNKGSPGCPKQTRSGGLLISIVCTHSRHAPGRPRPPTTPRDRPAPPEHVARAEQQCPKGEDNPKRTQPSSAADIHVHAHLVDEQVLAAVIGGDEAEALGGVEPFDGSLGLSTLSHCNNCRERADGEAGVDGCAPECAEHCLATAWVDR